MQNNTNQKFISRTEMQTILNGRPQGAQIKPILDNFVSMGYTVEGVNDKSAGSTNAPIDTSTMGGKIEQRFENIKEEIKAPKTLSSIVETPLRVVGQTAGIGVDAIGKVIENTVVPISKALNKAIDEGQLKMGLTTKEDLAKRDQMISDLTNGVIKSYESFKTQYPSIAKDAEAIFNIASIIPVVKGVSTGAKATKAAVAETQIAKDAAGAINSLKETVKNAEIPIVGNVVKNVKTKVNDFSENVKINRAEKAKIEKIVEDLGSETKKSAARSGIEIADINEIKGFDKSNLPAIQKMLKAADDYQAGNKAVDPLDLVGEPIRKKIINLSERADEVGKKLGETARGLKNVKNSELETAILDKLKKTSGLRGLKVKDRLNELGQKMTDKNGDPIRDLDFEETTLMSRANKAEREAIQTAFEEATRSGTGVSKHLYRQELFELLDGKKKSLSTLTDTQEKALDAIRGGLSDVLESKNAGYKDLSNQYRKIIQPLNDLRKVAKNVDPNNSIDILDEAAGNLARRLTSNAPSKVQIKKILQEIDKATSEKGTTLKETEDLMDAYNIMSKYYDLAGGTSLEGINTRSLSKTLSASGMADKVWDILESNLPGGATPAVKRAKLNELIQEALSSE